MLKRVLLSAIVAGTLVLNAGVAMAQTPEEDPTFVPMRNSLFGKPELVIPVGTTLTFYNFDAEVHDVVERDNLLFISPLINQGEFWQITFDTPGVYAYVCDLHANMEGVITVLDAVAAPEAAGY